ncbi:MAG: PilZ domain-containing protein [Vicinamibacteria bacterium]
MPAGLRAAAADVPRVEMALQPTADRDRRQTGRAPFVRRCTLVLEDGRSVPALFVNINHSGAYVARDDLSGAPAAEFDEVVAVGRRLTCRVSLPGREDELSLGGVVSWVNARQSHPVHSLPPGFGLTFDTVDARAAAAIERVMVEASARATLT